MRVALFGWLSLSITALVSAGMKFPVVFSSQSSFIPAIYCHDGPLSVEYPYKHWILIIHQLASIIAFTQYIP